MITRNSPALALAALLAVFLSIQPCSKALAQEAVLFDFGATLTTSPTNGNYWNNLPSGPSFTNFVTISNTASTWSLTFTSNVAYGGGTWAPSPTASLGVFNVATATTDGIYYATNDIAYPAGITFKLGGLDTAKSYNFDLYAGRDSTTTRITKYTVTGTNSTNGTLTTSGTGIGIGGVNYNNFEFLSLSNITPDGSGQIFVNLEGTTGGLGYLNAMQVTAVPEPATSALLALSGVAFAGYIIRRRARRS